MDRQFIKEALNKDLQGLRIIIISKSYKNQKRQAEHALMKTKHYLSKKLTFSIFGPRYYDAVKSYKILFDYLIGKDYEGIRKNISKILSDDDVILDIGANMGQYLMRLSKIVTKGQIISIEPVLGNIKALQFVKKTLRLKNVTIIPKAISASAGYATVIIPKINGIPISTQASLVNIDSIEDAEKLEVETTTIDDLVVSLNLQKVEFIKLDTEGFDSVALRSGMNTIDKFKPLIRVEENCFNPEMDWLFEIGYSAFKIINRKVVLINTNEDNMKYKGDTFLAHRKTMEKILNIFNG